MIVDTFPNGMMGAIMGIDRAMNLQAKLNKYFVSGYFILSPILVIWNAFYLKKGLRGIWQVKAGIDFYIGFGFLYEALSANWQKIIDDSLGMRK